MFRILAVDDNPVNLDITARMLRKAGYAVDTAVNGETGVEMAGRFRYDLIIMDMMLPGIGGGEATKLIRDAEKEAGHRRVPVIAFTADVVDECWQKARRGDMDDFITKPLEIRTLLAAVERSLDNRSLVLVADECPQDRDRTLRYLRGLSNVSTLGAGTGAEAVAACQRQRVTLALINGTLPDMSGVETAQQIRNLKYGSYIGIVAVRHKAVPDTAVPDNPGEGENASLGAGKDSPGNGFVGLLEKPYGQAEILDLIRPLMPAQ
jgi:CheY-like chemotaxis protein